MEIQYDIKLVEQRSIKNYFMVTTTCSCAAMQITLEDGGVRLQFGRDKNINKPYGEQFNYSQWFRLKDLEELSEFLVNLATELRKQQK